jgi:hypothetical protein
MSAADGRQRDDGGHAGGALGPAIRATWRSTPPDPRHPVRETLRLRRRKEELESGLRQPGGIRIMQERGLYCVREKLQRVPTAIEAILKAARLLQRPVAALSADDVGSIP